MPYNFDDVPPLIDNLWVDLKEGLHGKQAQFSSSSKNHHIHMGQYNTETLGTDITAT